MPLSKDEKKKIKSDRLRLSVADVAKEMIMQDGIESATVREVADRAGYSIGTIYNHFDNLDEVLWLAREAMIMDMHKELSLSQNLANVDDLIASFNSYIDFYISNPYIFKFFFFHHLDGSVKPKANVMEGAEIADEMAKTIEFISSYSKCSQEEAMLTYKSIIYMIHGMLVLIISGNDGLTKQTIESELVEMINRMMK